MCRRMEIFLGENSLLFILGETLDQRREGALGIGNTRRRRWFRQSGF